MATFTQEQLAAIEADGKTIVSASAGSGKTTVMIEKISNLLIKDSVDVDNLLVVTFTVLAAQEMKERLVNNLKEILVTSNEEEKESIS